jgi:formiminoglutamase
MGLARVKQAGQAVFRDRDEVKASQWLEPWDGQSSFDIGVIGVPLSKTSISHSGAFMFPQSVRQALGSFGTYHLDADLDLSECLRAVDLGDVEMHVTDMSRCHRNIEEAARQLWSLPGDFVSCAIGGDHSISAPLIGALADVSERPVGVIHFDAHHDMRNLEDGGRTNGTPFRTLIESGQLDGTRLAQIGLRNFANAQAYTAYARDHGVTLYTVRKVRELGLSNVLGEAIRIAGRDDAILYVSFDLDVLDQAHAPGVPAPGPFGMDIWDACDAMERLGQLPNVRGFDWVCADPTVDVRNLTSRVAASLFLHAAAGVAKRRP